ncbi:MAG TPA: DMT family transporter [Gaiellaceae bacterium]|jgi:drug/metabolite transporter (DMT)-like permease
MRARTTTIGALFATSTALAWGGQFVVGKSALGTVNAFPLTTVRYAFAAGIWLLVLVAVEGRGALRLGERGLRLFWLGTLGFAGFNLLAYTGLAHARPQSASLIVALGPLLTALVLWRRTRVRPPGATFALLGVALAGVALVISGGQPASIVDGSIGWGDALVFAGVFSFVLYGLGAADHAELSPLRYTALTASLGWLTVAAATAVAVASGLVAFPSGHELWSVSPQIAYLTIPGAAIAVLTWNAAIGSIGPQNAVLFGNLIPVTTFAIEIARGYRPGAVELGGAALTVAALVANNLLARRPRRSVQPEPAEEREGELELARAA